MATSYPTDNWPCDWNFNDILDANVTWPTSSCPRVFPTQTNPTRVTPDRRCRDPVSVIFESIKGQRTWRGNLHPRFWIVFYSWPETQGLWQHLSLRHNAVPTEPTVVAMAAMFNSVSWVNNLLHRLKQPRRDLLPMRGYSLR